MAAIITQIKEAATLLNNNVVVAIPTETGYGLAGNIYSAKAVEQIFTIKQRPFYNPLIVHIPSINSLNKIAAEIPGKARQLAELFWPGPLTLVLNKQPSVPDLVTGGKDTVAVRIPNHPLTLSLLVELDFPLAAPSPNLFGTISPTTVIYGQVAPNNLLYKCGWSPLSVERFTSTITQTFVNGYLVFDQEIIIDCIKGKRLLFERIR